jgi:hypothetical protein
MAPRVTASPPPLPAGAKPDGLVVKIAKCIRYEPWSYKPGSQEWNSYERYRGHTLRQALAITDALETLPPDMMKAGADALSAIFETDDPAGDLRKIWSAMIAFAKAQYEVESDQRKQQEQELKWARQAIEDEEAAKRGRLR